MVTARRPYVSPFSDTEFIANRHDGDVPTITRPHPRDEAWTDIFDYIERFYNPQRLRSTLGQSLVGSSRRHRQPPANCSRSRTYKRRQ